MSLDYATEEYNKQSMFAKFLLSLKGVTKFSMDQVAMDSTADGVTRLYDNGEPVVSGEAWERAGGVRWRVPAAPAEPTTSSVCVSPAPAQPATSSVRSRVYAHLPRSMRVVN